MTGINDWQTCTLCNGSGEQRRPGPRVNLGVGSAPTTYVYNCWRCEGKGIERKRDTP